MTGKSDGCAFIADRLSGPSPSTRTSSCSLRSRMLVPSPTAACSLHPPASPSSPACPFPAWPLSIDPAHLIPRGHPTALPSHHRRHRRHRRRPARPLSPTISTLVTSNSSRPSHHPPISRIPTHLRSGTKLTRTKQPTQHPHLLTT